MYSLACGAEKGCGGGDGDSCNQLKKKTKPIYVGMGKKHIDELSPTEAGCEECGWKPDDEVIDVP